MTNLYLISENENLNTCPKPQKGCHENSYAMSGASHLKSIFNDDPKKCFDNAISKKVFTEKQVLSDDYIMYMCSDDSFDYFKSKLTKTKYQVKRSNV